MDKKLKSIFFFDNYSTSGQYYKKKTVLKMNNPELSFYLFIYLFIYLHGEFKASACLIRLLLDWNNRKFMTYTDTKKSELLCNTVTFIFF